MKYLFAITLLALPAPATAQPPRHAFGQEQDAAFRARRAGEALPLRAIEGALVPAMKAKGADYIGSEYDPPSARYRLKFMRGSRVIWIDVDGRTGSVLGRAGD